MPPPTCNQSKIKAKLVRRTRAKRSEQKKLSDAEFETRLKDALSRNTPELEQWLEGALDRNAKDAEVLLAFNYIHTKSSKDPIVDADFVKELRRRHTDRQMKSPQQGPSTHESPATSTDKQRDENRTDALLLTSKPRGTSEAV